MKKFDKFINQYSVTKVVKFSAIPVGKTQEFINERHLIEKDKDRAEKAKKAKDIMDRYHIRFIDKVLDKIELADLSGYVEIFNKKNKSDSDKDALAEYEASYRKQISKAFQDDDEYSTLFNETIIKDVLPKKLTDEEENAIIRSFIGFTTAFTGYFTNRKNLYSEDDKATSIAHRCIGDNLPRFLSNQKCFKQIRQALGDDVMDQVTKELELDPYSAEDCFRTDFFNNVLTSKGITFYNTVIGGISIKEGKKIKGLNEYINLYNQQGKGTRLPMLKPLYKQMLTCCESASYRSEGYKNNQDMFSDIKSVVGINSKIADVIGDADRLISTLGTYDLSGIYVTNGKDITNISQRVTGNWNDFADNWNSEYDKCYTGKLTPNTEKYDDARKKCYKKIESFSLTQIADHLHTEDKKYTVDDIVGLYRKRVTGLICEAKEAYQNVKDLLDNESNNKLKDGEINRIKSYLDPIKDLENELRSLEGTGKEEDRDDIFYGELTMIIDTIQEIDELYNRVRNHVTKKPYSSDKYKLYFNNPALLNGWDRNKVSDYRTTLLRIDGRIHLAIIDEANSKILEGLEDDSATDFVEVLNYKLIPGASKMLPHIFISSKKGRELYSPSQEIIDIAKNKTYAKSSGNFSLDDCHKLIDYYKNALMQHEYNDIYGFEFTDTKDYKSIDEFFREVDAQGYKLSFYKVDKEKIRELVENGNLYLFMLYTKDFSPNSHGKQNLQTILFNQLFNEDNNNNIKLCGLAEMFFRKASISKENMIVHPAEENVKNKNPLNEKKESLFKYDLIKDKRYTKDHYEIHIPIQLNRTPDGQQILNNEVREELRADENTYTIGIDRGERNLIYITVIDGNNNIVEQMSLNEIVNEHKNTTIKTDYNDLLNRKQVDRLKARQRWTTIENIKELKEGYISQVIHKICTLAIKYDAVIAMEDLTSGFKNSRTKIEKQVYQKFEEALIRKLSYLTDKNIEIGENGSATRAFQLTNSPSVKMNSKQNGFVFYIPPWLTSKIDPVTGFADLIRPKYVSIQESRNLINTFDGIRYNKTDNMFEFDIDYSKFPYAEIDHKKKWTICTNGTRVKTFRNPDKNGTLDNEEVVLTDEYIKLFSRYGIEYSEGDLRLALSKPDEKQFYMEFISLLKLTLQIRNSISGSNVDYILSPVRDKDGNFFDSRRANDILPQDADANGAYNIARKASWAIKQIKQADNAAKFSISITNKEWLKYVQG